jgi:hypothetical protein
VKALLLAAMIPVAAMAQRPPEPGCAWRPFTGLGLSLKVQDCSDPGLRYVFSVKGDWIEQHRPSDDATFGAHQVIRVLTKPAQMPIEQAVLAFARPTLPPEAHGACAVVRAERSPLKGKGKVALTLMPTGAYAKKIDSDLQDEPRDFGCGEYGADQPVTYFEYHPAESRTRFLYVVYGEDAPLFDEQSIQIGNPR